MLDQSHRAMDEWKKNEGTRTVIQHAPPEILRGYPEKVTPTVPHIQQYNPEYEQLESVSRHFATLHVATTHLFISVWGFGACGVGNLG